MKRLSVAFAALLLSVSSASAGATDFFTEFAKDFGVTPRGPVLTHYFMIRNTSSVPVTIGSARVSCGCVSATVLKNQLAPGETTAVTALMDTRRIPQSYVTKSVIVYVPFLAPMLEEVTLRVQAIARDDLFYSNPELAFGTIKKTGQSHTTSIKVTLFNQPTWQITSVKSNGQFVSVEAKEINRQPAEVTYEVTATLDPNCPTGNWVSEVILKTNNPSVDNLRIPVSLNLVTPIAVQPEVVQAGQLIVDQAKEFKVTLQGTDAFKIKTIDGNDDVVVAKAETGESRTSHTLTINITPKAQGELSRTLEVQTDSKEMPTIRVPLTATVAASK